MSTGLRSKAKAESTPRQTRSQAAAAAGSSTTNSSPALSLRSQKSKAADQENSKPIVSGKAIAKESGKKAKVKTAETGKTAAVKEEEPVADPPPTKSTASTRSKNKAQPKVKTRTSTRGKSTKKEDKESNEEKEGDEEKDEEKVEEKVEPDVEAEEVKGNDEGEVYCVCKGKDDGSPMIKCEGECQNWYHFGCISMGEEDADRVAQYICPECEVKSGRKTQWEVPAAKTVDDADTAKDKKMESPEPMAGKKEPKEDEDESEGEGSGDDYVAEAEPVGKGRRRSTIARKKSMSSQRTLSELETSNEDEDTRSHPRRLSRGQPRANKRFKKAISKSPAPEAQAHGHGSLKRRASTATWPESKRARTEDDANERASGKDDPVRKYCLSKMEEVIKSIFLENLAVEKPNATESGGDAGADASGANGEAGPSTQPLKQEESCDNDERKAALEEKASAFVVELEQCMFDAYAEPDKNGNPHASGKYKERFRMITFNLGKTDRVILRRDIAAGRIQPAQLNTMSSTELADEKTKHEIEVLEKEALEHSTLNTITAPRAKITHKGFEAIEDVTGMGQRNQDVLREEEERMERERMERARLARTRISTHGSPTATEHPSMSPGVPMSPVTPTSATPWGAPPPLPLHVMQVDDGTGMGSGMGSNMMLHTGGRLHPRPLFVPSASDFGNSMEGGLNLADLINIDDDPSSEEGINNALPPNPPRAESESTASVTPEVVTPSGPSPFAANLSLESPRRPSFDLNTLWTGTQKEPEKEEPAQVKEAPEEVQQQPELTEQDKEQERGDSMELESVEEEETKDQDFDMFLNDEREGNGESKEAPVVPVIETVDVESLPPVWVGGITMPRENNIPLVPSVIAKQVGGRTLDLNSGLWQVLFPSTATRIDGRVPVEKSSQYLVSMRLNSAKELIAVCFTPTTEVERQKYDELIAFLLGKGRHALVFPWGEHPKPDAPGRELYIIPLLREQPIPEYMELLDDLRLPQTRKTNVLLGVFVLNKGKLVAPPIPPPTTQPPPVPHTVPSPAFQLPTGGPSSSALPAALAGVNPAALAAEVASLTPEQISLMLRHLSQTQATPQNSPPPPGAVPPPGFPPVPTSVPPVPGGFSPSRPPPNGYPYQPPPPLHPLNSPHQRQSSPPGRRESFEDYDSYDDDYSRRPFGRDDRGRGGRGRSYDRGRGRGGSRGRGRPYDRADGRYHDRGDSSWGGRGRNDGPSRSPPDYSRGSRYD